MSQPIPVDQIIFAEREMRDLNIEPLAESIQDVGLQVPIILSPLEDGRFLLEAGGRRFLACQALGITHFYHASTGVPGRPGYVLKESVSSKKSTLLTELVENLHRENLDWRHELRLLVAAWRELKKSADLAGEKVTYAILGQLLGNYSHADINAAVQIHDDVIANPTLYKDTTTIKGAYVIYLKEVKNQVQKELASRVRTAPSVQAQAEPQRSEHDLTLEVLAAPKVIDLTSRFNLGNSMTWMEGMAANSIDHIVCDPDFAVSKERLASRNWSPASSDEGVAQEDVETSLGVLQMFLANAARITRGFVVFFYDLDHHEKLQSWAETCGLLVQRWPLIWHKVDARANAAPEHNFCKNMEYAMVCRKPGVTLAQSPQMSSIIALPSGSTTKDFDHPFSKPIDLWTRIFRAVALPGQTVLDPFAGAGSSVIAALRFGLQPLAGEMQEQHFNKLLLHVQSEYRRSLGPSVTFS